MGICERPWILEDSLDGRVVTFSSNNTQWRLTRKLSEKPWEGSDRSRDEYRDGDEEWDPCEAHAVYECEQTRGVQVGAVAVVKVRIDDDPEERAKEASGMRLNSYTRNEMEILEKLTAAACPVTPTLLAVQIDEQDPSVLRSEKCGFEWWMPGGYIVYILMNKLEAEPLELNSYWLDTTRQERDQIRSAFQKSYMVLRKLGIHHMDKKIANLMWDAENQKCYIIDFENADDDPEFANPAIWTDSNYFLWQLARSYQEPNW
ncbi:MAG: hypothetical protein Q9216_002062 [Gyalolechia sp. 2 TL-2023]